MGYRESEKKTIKASKSMKAYCSKKIISGSKCLGIKEKSILEPSSGGMGTRLKSASAKFTRTIEEVIK